jgi:cytoskeletal protein RodZ
MNNPVTQLSRDQLDALTDLGRRLQQLRELKGLSLEQVAARTLVSKKILAAIETANVAHLPEPVYIQGFIRRYADALDVNGAAFASDFTADAVIMGGRRAPVGRFAIQAQLRPLHLYLLYLVVVGTAVSGLSFILNRTSSPIVVSVPDSPAPATQPTTQPAAPAPVAPNTALPPSAIAKSVRLDMKLTDQSWVRVMTDGKMDFEGVLPQGTQRLWTADKQIVVRAGNAGGVVVSLNNGQAKPLGLPGSVEEVTFGSAAQAAASGKAAQTLATSTLQPAY